MVDLNAEEPSEEQIKAYENANNVSYYTARDCLRILAYGDTPTGYASWGDYWKTY